MKSAFVNSPGYQKVLACYDETCTEKTKAQKDGQPKPDQDQREFAGRVCIDLKGLVTEEQVVKYGGTLAFYSKLQHDLGTILGIHTDKLNERISIGSTINARSSAPAVVDVAITIFRDPAEKVSTADTMKKLEAAVNAADWKKAVNIAELKSLERVKVKATLNTYPPALYGPNQKFNREQAKLIIQMMPQYVSIIFEPFFADL